MPRLDMESKVIFFSFFEKKTCHDDGRTNIIAFNLSIIIFFINMNYSYQILNVFCVHSPFILFLIIVRLHACGV